MIKRWTGILLGVSMVVGVVGAQALDPKEVAAGKRLFTTKNCVQCHMVEGKGNRRLMMDGPNTKLAKLTPEEISLWITSPEEMTAKLKLAQPPANPMKKVDATPDEVKALVAYLRSRQPKS